MSRDYSDTDSVSEKVLSDANHIYRGGEGVFPFKVYIYILGTIQYFTRGGRGGESRLERLKD